MDNQALRDNLETIISSIQEISLVYLFGSQVGGKVGPMSDYDLGVLIDRDADQEQTQAEFSAQCCIDISHRIISLENALRPADYYGAILCMDQLGILPTDFRDGWHPLQDRGTF